jgi:hypothetical protein
VIPVEKQIRWTEADSEGLAKLMALDRFIAGDDAFDEVIKDAIEFARAADVKRCMVCRREYGTGHKMDCPNRGYKPDPLDPEPEDDEETITYPEVWDRHGGKITIAVCVLCTSIVFGAVWAWVAAFIEQVNR